MNSNKTLKINDLLLTQNVILKKCTFSHTSSNTPKYNNVSTFIIRSKYSF